MNEAILTALAPHGELRAAINMSNFLEGKRGVGDDDFFTPGGNLFQNAAPRERHPARA